MFALDFESSIIFGLPFLFKSFFHFSLYACLQMVQGIWGETEEEAAAEERRRKEFIQKNVSEYQGHFTYLEDSFKVRYS